MSVTVRVTTSKTFASAAADLVSGQLRTKPDSVLALPTGQTPLGLYAELARRAENGTLDASRLRIFNLDDYVGLPDSDPHSYAAFMLHHVVEPLHLRRDQVRLLRGAAADLEAECLSYDAALAACGGIDLCILGLGVNGHIAFNEPGSEWTLDTHIVHLSHATRAAHERQAEQPWRIPFWGITMGIGTVLRAKRIVLLIAGERKELAKAAFQRGTPDRDYPVTSLCGHPDVTVIELCAPAPAP